MIDIVARLRADAEYTDDIGLCAEAADEIERLRAEVERLQTELGQWMNHWRTKL